MNRQTSSLKRMLSRAVRCLLVLSWCSSIALGVVRHGIYIQESHSVSLAQSGIARISACPSSDRIVLLTSDNLLRVFEGSTLAEQTALLGAESKISVFNFSSDGRSLVAGTADGKMLSWDLTGGTLTKSFGVVSVPIVGLEALKGSQVLVVAGDGNLEVRDWASGDKVTSLSQINEEITCQVLHPNGKWCLFGTSIGRIHVYDLAESQDVKIIPVAGGKVTAIGISSDGRFLVTGSSDGNIRTWDARGMTPRNTLAGQHGDITSLTIDPKSRWLEIITTLSQHKKKPDIKSGFFLTALVANLNQNHRCLFSNIDITVYSRMGRHIPLSFDTHNLVWQPD